MQVLPASESFPPVASVSVASAPPPRPPRLPRVGSKGQRGSRGGPPHPKRAPASSCVCRGSRALTLNALTTRLYNGANDAAAAAFAWRSCIHLTQELHTYCLSVQVPELQDLLDTQPWLVRELYGTVTVATPSTAPSGSDANDAGADANAVGAGANDAGADANAVGAGAAVDMEPAMGDAVDMEPAMGDAVDDADSGALTLTRAEEGEKEEDEKEEEKEKEEHEVPHMESAGELGKRPGWRPPWQVHPPWQPPAAAGGRPSGSRCRRSNSDR
eukprot:1177499-Prorocentrum_minimum.AAC.1